MANSTLFKLREEIRKHTHADEALCVQRLLENNVLTPRARQTAKNHALHLVEKCRENPDDHGVLDAFLLEYSLSTQEGVALMCLAEALLRIPDADTKDRLISEKILSGDWNRHRGKSEKLFVNAATWGMILTGEIVRLDAKITADPSGWLGSLVGRVGEPAVRFGVMQAMKLMGQQYVLGSSIGDAIERGKKDNSKGTRFSFDMLGEGARTADQAKKYFDAYMNAIQAIGLSSASRKFIDDKDKNIVDVISADGISVKLTALHPRYEYRQRERVISELLPRVKELAVQAKRLNIGFNIDAEEAARLDIELDIFEALACDPELGDWDGLGFVLQAYQKRALNVVDWLVALAKHSQRRIMVRLVKGAYWDAEIKHAQEMGFEDYPVFTRKANTDLSYQVCAARLLSHTNLLYPQFATHNAYTVAVILQLAEQLGAKGNFEFQRLHGMGDLLYKYLAEDERSSAPLRVYAPVGVHADLLPYLVRRLLENGANCSFVNQFLDKKLPARHIVGNVEEDVSELPGFRHSKIPVPRDIFRFNGQERDNSKGFDLDDPDTAEFFASTVEEIKNKKFSAAPIISGTKLDGKGYEITSPGNQNIVVGYSRDATAKDVEDAVNAAETAQSHWQKIGCEERGAILNKAADILEERTVELCALISLEAGRTLADGISEVREAVDFCRYYSFQVNSFQVNSFQVNSFQVNSTQLNSFQISSSHKSLLPSFVSQTDTSIDEVLVNGRGIFLCISPWNFPLAIFVGQVAAALIVGNSVIAKPAEQTPLVATLAIEILHQAGVPTDVLHMLPGVGSKLGPLLLADSRISGVAFTGSNETAKRIQADLLKRGGDIAPLIAETGGQNAMIVDSTALHEQVVDDVIQSAFFSAGQRCSALRVLFVQEDVADNLIVMLKGAIEFLNIGQPWELSNDIGPVIDAKALDMLSKHLKRMHQESLFIGRAKLCQDLPNGHYFAPHIFEIDSLSRLPCEIFGPILHVIRYKASEIDKVVEQINHSGYGLTLGIHSRLNSFANKIFNQTRVGNTYVNRNMVGAVVGVNPFGGHGLSGTGFKAGGPHYLLRFSNLWPSNSFSPVEQKAHYGYMIRTVENEESLAIDFEKMYQAQRNWNSFSGERRLEKLKSVVDKLDDRHGVAKVFGSTFHAYTTAIFEQLSKFTVPINLPGPTGESNQLFLGGRGIFLVLVNEKYFEQHFLLSLAAVAAGNALVFMPTSEAAVSTTKSVVAYFSESLPQGLVLAEYSHFYIEAFIRNQNISGVTAYRQTEFVAPIIRREGSIIPFVEELSWPFTLLPFSSEKTKTNNIVATGGNAFLLNLTEEP